MAVSLEIGRSDQPRSISYNAPCGPEANADFASIRERVKKYAAALRLVLAADWMAARLGGELFESEKWLVRANGEVVTAPF